MTVVTVDIDSIGGALAGIISILVTLFAYLKSRDISTSGKRNCLISHSYCRRSEAPG